MKSGLIYFFKKVKYYTNGVSEHQVVSEYSHTLIPVVSTTGFASEPPSNNNLVSGNAVNGAAIGVKLVPE